MKRLALLFALVPRLGLSQAPLKLPPSMTSLAASIADVVLSHHCIDAGTCHESNPLMRSRAASFAVGVGTAAVANGAAFVLKRRHVPRWFVPQLAAVGAHAERRAPRRYQ